jgi:hypothetical protein
MGVNRSIDDQMNISLAAIRTYATAAAKKGADKSGLKTKQVFMKKMKASKAAAASGPVQIGVNRTAPLQQALFSIDPAYRQAAESSNGNQLEQQRRKIIDEAWKRHEENRIGAMTAWEEEFIRGKLKAMKELEEISPRLFAAAIKIDYSLPPVYRRIATATPPHPDKFPIM